MTDVPDRPPRGPEEHQEYKRLLGLRKREDLLALSKNHDPFFMGSPSHWRDARWFAEQWRRFGERGHLRFVHYRLLGTGTAAPKGGPYQNTQRHWQDLCMASACARVLGLVDPEELEDKRNAEIREFAATRYADPEVSWSWRRQPWESLALEPRPRPPEWRIPSSASGPPYTILGGWLRLPEAPAWELPQVPGLSLPSVQPWEIRWRGLEPLAQPAVDIAGYDYQAADQSALLELWIEKSTMDDVLEPLCRALHINLMVGKGYESYTRIVELLRRAERCHTRRAHVLYVSDRDDAGDRMPTTVARHAQFFAETLDVDVEVTLERVALTPEQIRTYGLPDDPAKPGAVELDALEALHPGVLANLVRQAVPPWRDPTMPARLAETAGQARSAIDEQWEQDTEGLGDDLADLDSEVREVLGRYPERFRALAVEMAPDLAPERAERDGLAADVAATLETFRPRLEELAAELNAALGGFGPPLEELEARVDAKRDRYQQRADALKAELDAELEPLGERLEELASEAAQVLEEFDPELPDRPEPTEPDVDRDGLLYDSGRSWWEQLTAFKRGREVTPSTEQSA